MIYLLKDAQCVYKADLSEERVDLLIQYSKSLEEKETDEKKITDDIEKIRQHFGVKDDEIQSELKTRGLTMVRTLIICRLMRKYGFTMIRATAMVNRTHCIAWHAMNKVNKNVYKLNDIYNELFR